MMTTRILTAAALALALAACAMPGPQVRHVTLSRSFDPNEVAWFSAPGHAIIDGQALLRTRGGDVRTCAGFKATLTPMSDYARQRMSARFGDGPSGFQEIHTVPIKFDNEAQTGFSQYERIGRETTCDAQGNFTFSELPPGSYYVTAPVGWQIPGGRLQGGWLMRRVNVERAQIVRVILTAP